MCTRGNFLGLSLMACHVTAGWVAPSVHIADSVKSAYPSLATLSLIPDGLSHDARCSHVVVYCDAVMVGCIRHCLHGYGS